MTAASNSDARKRQQERRADAEPVARLREAARVLRWRAVAATPGPWECYGDHLVWPSEHGPGANDPVAGMIGGAHEDSADYIATMHPGVGAALADWLTSVARSMVGTSAGDVASEVHALAVADQILGEA